MVIQSETWTEQRATIKELLGEGRFGDVYRVAWLESRDREDPDTRLRSVTIRRVGTERPTSDRFSPVAAVP